MKQGTRESLAGRFFEYIIEPLNFKEFLNFKNINIDFDRSIIFRNEIEKEFIKFVKSGGYIEAINFDDFQI